jgi:hypothetical protein
LAKIWRLCCKVAQLKATSEHFSVAWSLHPLGKPLLKSIIDHCINSGKEILGCQVLTYSYLPVNRAANLIVFWEKTLLGPTRLSIFEIFPSKPYFYLNK